MDTLATYIEERLVGLNAQREELWARLNQVLGAIAELEELDRKLDMASMEKDEADPHSA